MYVYTHREVYMRTNIVLDDRLIKEALKLSRTKTKKELVNLDLKEFIKYGYDNSKMLEGIPSE